MDKLNLFPKAKEDPPTVSDINSPGQIVENPHNNEPDTVTEIDVISDKSTFQEPPAVSEFTP